MVTKYGMSKAVGIVSHNYDDTGQNGESEKNWAQQIEEGYDLQLTLALRLTTEDLHFLGMRHFDCKHRG